MKTLWNGIKSTVDDRDVTFTAGLALFAFGLWQVSPTYALIGSGCVLLFAALKG